MEAIEGIKVFRLNQYEWWAGRTLEECLAAASALSSLPREEIEDRARELTNSEMNILQFVADEAIWPARVTTSFRTQLQILVSGGTLFPVCFATTEI